MLPLSEPLGSDATSFRLSWDRGKGEIIYLGFAILVGGKEGEDARLGG